MDFYSAVGQKRNLQEIINIQNEVAQTQKDNAVSFNLFVDLA